MCTVVIDYNGNGNFDLQNTSISRTQAEKIQGSCNVHARMPLEARIVSLQFQVCDTSPGIPEPMVYKLSKFTI